MKILIVPYSDNPYDQRMARGFAEGFIQIGEEAFAVPEAISPEVISQFCDMLSINVVIHINGMRDLDTALPAKVRYISWIQDFFYDIFNNVTERFLSSDILYVLGDVSILRDFNLQCQVRSLFMGIESTIASYRSQSSLKADIDFSLCGYIPGPPNTKKKLIYDLTWYFKWLCTYIPVLNQYKKLWASYDYFCRQRFSMDIPLPNATLLQMKNITETIYKPLRGELNSKKIAHILREKYFLCGNRIQRTKLYDISPCIDKAIDYFAQRYPRLLDRVALVNMALSISKRVHLYGIGWDQHVKYKPYHKPLLNDQSSLLNVYRKSCINLCNNTDGLGLHSRVLECMAVGGFVMMHRSLNDTKSGGMLTAFEPGIHYGQFTPEDFHEEALYWLHNEKERKEAGIRAARIVFDQHCWHHRAKQVMNDLKK